MYTPNSQTVQSGYRGVNVDFSPLTDTVNRNTQRSSELFIEHAKNRYKETSDLYDIQMDEMKNLDSVLDGAKGQDYLYLQKSVVEARDRVKELFKGRTPKEFRTPEFQTELYNIKRDLSKKKNSIDTFYSQIQNSQELSNSPSIRKKEWHDYILSQVSLPPDQRDPDIVQRLQTDPLFFNPYDYTVTILETLGKADKQIQRETDDLILNYDATYRPDLGSYNEKGEFEFAPSEDLVKRILSSDKRFFNAMVGMLPAEQANKLVNEGNTSMLNEAVLQQTREYLKTVHGFGPDEKQTGKTVKSWQYYKPTASQTKQTELTEEINAIQQRLLNGDTRAFDDYLSADFWQSFDYEYDNDGKITAVVATHIDQDAPKWKKNAVKTEYVAVDPNDPGSVKQALNRIKYFAGKDKKQVTADPLKKPIQSALKAKYSTTDGKEFTVETLKKMGYTEEQILQAVKLGNLK